VVYLQALDYYWKEHLSNMDSLKEGIGLRGYGQKNPLHEYQQESFELFAAMMMTVKSVVVQNIFVPDLPSDAEIKALENREREAQRAQEAAARTVHEEADSVVADNSQPDTSGLNRAQRRRVSAQNPSSAAVNAPEDAPTQAALLAHFREQRVKGKKKK
jgi:preprotein translocase subunit SecA